MFTKISNSITNWVGKPTAVILAFVVIMAWAITGPLFGFSDTWQLIINTGTTIVTFLMVFLIQASQNRSDKATHVKLDAIIESLEETDNRLVAIEERDEYEIEEVQIKQKKVADARDN